MGDLVLILICLHVDFYYHYKNCRFTWVFAYKLMEILTTSLEASFSGVCGGSPAAGLLDGMVGGGWVKPRLEGKMVVKIKAWEGPSEAPGAASFNLSAGLSISLGLRPHLWEEIQQTMTRADSSFCRLKKRSSLWCLTKSENTHTTFSRLTCTTWVF